MGFQPSYLWRSICIARKLAIEGLAWQVGNGERINCWIGTIKPTRPRVKEDRDVNISRVSELINAEVGSWNGEKIRQCFDEDDANRILEIPISQFRREDRVFWVKMKNGIYSVKTAYQLAVKQFSKCGKSLASPSKQDKL